MRQLGDYDPGDTIHTMFNTAGATGAPIALAGTPSLAVYKDNGTTQDADGLTLTQAFDGVVGLHHVAIDTSADATFYSAGGTFHVVIAAGTVDGISVVGYLVCSFTLRKVPSAVTLAKLDDTLEDDGGTYRFTTNALEQAPSGGGGGSGDWTADERTAIRTILGVPASGTTPGVPSAGALKVIDDLIDTEVGALQSDVSAIKAKTDNLPSDPADASVVAGLIAGVEAKVDTVDTVVDAIKAKTDNLPTDPADASDIAASHASLASSLTTINSNVLTIDGVVDAIQAKTDNLPTDPADASVVAGLIAAVEAKVDTVDTVAVAIKAKTDNLPSDPADASVVAGLIAAVEAKVDVVDAVADAIKATTDKVDDTLEDDSGTYRFTTNALEQAPSGGGGGGTDWTADEREAIRTILGVPSSGTTPDVPAAGALKVLDDLIDTEVAAIKAKTDNLPANPAAASDIPTAAENADKLLGRNLAGGADGGRTVQDALRPLRNKTSIAGGTMTVCEEDDATTAWTAAVTTTPGDPLSAIDPA